jgi:hypothetical protein
MNPIKYVMGLVSKKSPLNNERIESQITNVRDTIVNHTIPQVEKVVSKLADGRSFETDVYSLYNDAITSGVQTRLRGNMFTVIKEALNSSVQTLSLIDRLVAADFQTDTTASALTLSKANTIQLLDTVNLVSNYTRSLVNAVLVAEENRLIADGRSALDGVSEAEVEYLAAYRDAYIRGLNIVLTPVEAIEDRFKQIPEIVVSEIRSQAATASHGNDKIDPLRFGLFESKLDPVWLIGNMWTQYQYSKHVAAKEQAAVIELRIERIKAILDKKPNPQLAKVLEKREGQRDLLVAKVRRLESQWDA